MPISKIISNSSLLLPKVPTLSATVPSQGATQINLSWSADPAQPSYVLYRSTDNVNFTQRATLAAGVSSYSDSVSWDTTYYYKIEAVNRWLKSTSSTVSNSSPGWPFGSDGALSIGAGQTVYLNPGAIKDYSSINIASGGQLVVNASASPAPVIIGCAGTCVINGSIIARNGTHSGGTWSNTVPAYNVMAGSVLSYTVSQSSGGSGGSGGASSKFAGGAGGGQGSGNGGGGGGGSSANNTTAGSAGSAGTASAAGTGGAGSTYSDSPTNTCAAGGGGNGGTKGRHGQAVALFIKGALSGSGGAIDVTGVAGSAGAAGANGASSGSILYEAAGGGGGGGGAGGSGGRIWLYYRQSFTGTINRTWGGGAAGSGGGGGSAAGNVPGVSVAGSAGGTATAGSAGVHITQTW